MSRVQLALNVSDLDEAVEFYSKLFATGPAKVRPGYANFAVADPPLKLVLIEDADAGSRFAEPSRRRSSDDGGGHGGTGQAGSREPPDGHRGERELLLRPPGQGVGRRPRG